MTSGAHHETAKFADRSGTRDERRDHKIAQLYATDPQFRAAEPNPSVIQAARRPGLRLAEVLQTLVDGYHDRPAVGQRARELTTDPATGRTSARLLPSFQTMSYGELWARVHAVAAAWRHNPTNPVSPGDFVATVGFGSPDYLIVDLVSACLDLVAVPLQHSAPASQLRPIIDEVEPRVVAVSAEYLDLAVESTLNSASLRHVVVFDCQPEIDDHRENLQRARTRLNAAGMPVVVETLAEIIERGKSLPSEPIFTEGSDDRLAMILYTSGSTGTPKGAMYTERMITALWTSTFLRHSDTPVINVNSMPLNHFAGRGLLGSSFAAGGTSYFVPKSDMSTLLEDWSLVRPTELAVVPRLVDMLFQGYRATVNRRILEGADPATAGAEAGIELREHVLGGRVLGGIVGSAPLALELAAFIDSCMDIQLIDLYGATEVGGVTRGGAIARPPVLDYKLVDIPELGYFSTDKPYPRGELLVKSDTATPGYYKHPEVTANVFDADGYYITGDVMAEIEPDRLVYLDRRTNVLKLSQGEFVAVTNLEAVFARASLVHQMFVYGNCQRANLLAVIVPTAEALARFDDHPARLKAALRDSLRNAANAAELQSYEIPIDFLIETEPFGVANGLLSGAGKILRHKLMAHYGDRLEQLYTDLAAAQVDELRALRKSTDRPILQTVTRAARAVLGSSDIEIGSDAHFTDLGGDSLSALTFSDLLADIFDIDVPVGVIINPVANLACLANYIDTQRGSDIQHPTFDTVHGQVTTKIHASDLTLDKFIHADTLSAAPALPPATGEPKTVLLTGANGYLGRFLTMEWLERLSQTGGTLIAVVRGRDGDAARARLEEAFDSGDPKLLDRFRALAANHLEVVSGDIGAPNLGLDDPIWQRLTRTVERVVHSAALVNHVLPYRQLFDPNVVGTAEVIRLAITNRIKPVSYLSTVAVAFSVPAADFVADDDVRQVSSTRPVDSGYANGYANSKWAGEVLLREAHDLCALPVAVFRSDMILAHSRYVGQLNVPDAFTRLIVSLLATGTAPCSFYDTDPRGNRSQPHYYGVSADFVAEAVTTLGVEVTDGYRSFDVMNPHDDGVSLDTFVDWLIDAGHRIHRIDDYNEWLTRFETTMMALPEKQRQHTVLPLLDAYRKPQTPRRGAPASTDEFRRAVRAAKIGADNDIPHISAALINKYVTDLQHLGLL